MAEIAKFGNEIVKESQKNVKSKTVLLVDDDESLRRVLEFQILQAGFAVLTAKNGVDALKVFAQNDVDCVITDLRMPQMSGLDLLSRLKTVRAATPVIVITAFGEIETAVAAMRQGAFDYVTKPFNRDEILLTLERAMDLRETKIENRRLREIVGERFEIENLIGESPKMLRVLDLVERVAQSDATILITGESGTGKELIAKGVHFSGSRANKPFVAINCAAIPENLIESELFGHKKGSFTNALLDTKGKFEEANGGTLFLDEIAEMPVNLQPKLLRVLQESLITRIGETKPRKIDVRIIAATNRDLQNAIKSGDFREDLYFRLAVIPIELPPLRERREDIPLLTDYFLKQFRRKYGYENLQIERSTIATMSNYPFAGNVRELENLVERLVVLSKGENIKPENLPEEFRNTSNSFGNVKLELPEKNFSLEDLEREILRRALESNNGNQSQAANYLGITRSALIYRMQKYNLIADLKENHAT